MLNFSETLSPAVFCVLSHDLSSHETRIHFVKLNCCCWWIWSQKWWWGESLIQSFWISMNWTWLGGCSKSLCLRCFTKASAGLLPLALCAPEFSVLHSVHFPALLGISSWSPQGTLGRGAVRFGRQANVLSRRLK